MSSKSIMVCTTGLCGRHSTENRPLYAHVLQLETTVMCSPLHIDTSCKVRLTSSQHERGALSLYTVLPGWRSQPVVPSR